MVAGSPNPFFTDRLFEVLRENTAIEKLDVDTDWMPPSSFKLLGEALAVNKALRCLSLRHFKMTNTDMEILVKGMKWERRLRLLSLHDMELPHGCLNSLFSYLEQLDPPNFEELHFSHVQLLSGSELLCKMLRTNKHVKKLRITQCPNSYSFIGHVMEALACHEAIEDFLFSSPDNRAPPEFFMALPKLISATRIKKLVLDGLS